MLVYKYFENRKKVSPFTMESRGWLGFLRIVNLKYLRLPPDGASVEEGGSAVLKKHGDNGCPCVIFIFMRLFGKLQVK